MARLFFALPPPPAVREAIAAVQRQVVPARARPVPVANLHLTLAFLGETDAATCERLRAHQPPPDQPAFELALARLGTWRRRGVLWLGPAAEPAALGALAAFLLELAAGAGLALPKRDFRPHVTLARRWSGPPRPRVVAPIPWRVEEYALMRSQAADGGVRYEALACWSLAPPR